MMEKVFRMLNNGKPFIYFFGEKALVVGASVFRACTQSEIDLCNTLHRQVDEIHRISYPLVEQDVADALETFSQICDTVDVPYDYANATNAANLLHTTIRKCTDAELRSLIEQRDLFIEMLDYQDGALYRHSK